jgi:flagellar assembly protein FliH
VTNSSSKPRPAEGPAAARSASPYARFIPREELRGFASWRPGALENAPAGDEPAEAAPVAPTEREWLERIAQARQAALQEGYQNGYRDGLVALESFKQSLAMQSTTQTGAFLARLDAEFDLLQPELAQAVARVAVDLARQVLRRELRQHPEVVSQVASQAVQAVLHSARHIAVHLHPEDVALVQQGATETLQARHARLVADATLARGDCVVKSDIGVIDARVATRWQQAATHLAHQAPWPGDAPATEET